MAVVVFRFDIVVVVDPIVTPRVIRRIDVDGVDLASMREQKCLECVVVLGVDDGVERFVAATLDLSGRDEAGVDLMWKRLNSTKFG